MKRRIDITTQQIKTMQGSQSKSIREQLPELLKRFRAMGWSEELLEEFRQKTLANLEAAEATVARLK